jgi:hypothetical protein
VYVECVVCVRACVCVCVCVCVRVAGESMCVCVIPQYLFPKGKVVEMQRYLFRCCIYGLVIAGPVICLLL